MFLKKGDDLFSSFAFRLTLKYSLLFAAILLCVFILSDSILSKNLLSKVDEHLLEEANEIIFLHKNRDLSHVLDEIMMESKSEGIENVFYRFLPSESPQFVESNLSKWQNFDFDIFLPLKPAKGETYFTTIKSGSKKEDLRVVLKTLDDGSFIQIGKKLAEHNELLYTYREVFGFSILFMLAVGTLLGWHTASQAMRGVKRITHTAQSISKGNLNQRVNLGNEGREIDELGYVFNEMLRKIQLLIEEMKDITNNIAHDLRSPITRIRGLAETTLLGKQDIEEYRQMAGLAVEECDRLEGMIDTLLEIAEADAKLSRIEKIHLDIVQLVKDGCELFEPVISDKHISFQLKTQDTPIFVLADVTRLQRVISNIIDNAIKFTPEKGTIEVQIKDYRKHVEILFIDSGIGIKKEELSRIFDRFYRCDRSRSSSGNGLGLSLVKSIVQSLNGEIAVESTPDKGSTFTVILPKADPA